MKMNASVSQDIDKLWSQWIDNRDEEAANKLIEHYMYLVDFHVERVASHIPASFDKRDLRSLGLMGLFDALNKFERSRKLKFSTYATIRIRGSIMDGLRKEDWLPRTLRDQTKQIEKATLELEQKLQRAPSSAEIAEELQINEADVEAAISHALFANIVSLESTVSTYDTEKDVEIKKTIEDEQAIHPDERVLFDELKDELVKSIKKLNKNEQMVISLFYQEELTLTEIGEVLNLTTSRISQIHKQAIFKLKDTLKKMNY